MPRPFGEASVPPTLIILSQTSAGAVVVLQVDQVLAELREVNAASCPHSIMNFMQIGDSMMNKSAGTFALIATASILCALAISLVPAQKIDLHPGAITGKEVHNPNARGVASCEIIPIVAL
jgi:hypothetical protein